MSSKINILILLHGYRFYSGIEQVTFTLLRHLNREKFNPYVVVSKDGPAKDYLEQNGIETFVIPLECDWIPGKRQFYWYLKEIRKRVEELQKIIETRNINLIHTHLTHVIDGAIAAKWANIPHVWHVHDPFEWDYKRFSGYMSPEGFGLFIDEMSDAIVPISDAVKKTFINYVPETKMPVICNGIDLKQFNINRKNGTGSFRKKLSVRADDILVSSVSRVSPEKKFEDLIEAASLVLKKEKNVKFAVVGEFVLPHYAEKLRSLISALKLDENFVLCGSVDDLFSVYRDTDVFVSCSEWEGNSLVCLEAMALAKPVIATECGGPEEIIVDNETGYLVPVNSPEEISTAVSKLVGDPDSRRKMGIKGRERVLSYFTADQYARKFELLYQRLCSMPRAKSVSHKVEIIMKIVDEIVSQNLKNIMLEERIKSLEGFMHTVKNNFIYKSAKKLYNLFRRDEK